MIRVTITHPGTLEAVVLSLDVVDGQTAAAPVLEGPDDAVRRVRRALAGATGARGHELGAKFTGVDLALALRGRELAPFLVRWLEGEDVPEKPIAPGADAVDEIARYLAWVAVGGVHELESPDPDVRARALDGLASFDTFLGTYLEGGGTLDGWAEAFAASLGHEREVHGGVYGPDLTAGHDATTLGMVLIGAFVGDAPEAVAERLVATLRTAEA